METPNYPRVNYQPIEQALRESEERFRLLAENSTDMISRHTPDGIYLYVSPACRTLLGYAPEDLIGHSAYEFFHPDDLAEIRQSHAAVLTLPNPYTVDYRICCQDGRYVWFETTSRTIRNAQTSAVIEIQATSRDITRRKQTEAALRESQQRAAALIDSLPGIAFSAAPVPGWPMKYLSEGCLDVTGYTSSEIVGTNPVTSFNSITHPEDRPTVLATIQAAIQQSQPYVIEYRIRTKSGQEKWLWEKGRGVWDHNQKLLSIEGFITDITERKQAEKELTQRAEELARSNADLEQFAYIVSHDLQEPLRMVAVYTQLLARRYKDKLDQDADDFIAFVLDGVTRMQTLISDLLSYSRVGMRGIEQEWVNCETVLKQAIANLQVRILENQVVLTHEALPTVRADAAQLVQLFQNLLSNAIKFRSETPPQIHISVASTEQDWVFSIQDNGIGIESRYAERIFVIFQRLHHQTAYPGTGIGLAICKRIVERHHGQIWIQSQLGVGSVFYFTLPK